LKTSVTADLRMTFDLVFRISKIPNVARLAVWGAIYSYSWCMESRVVSYQSTPYFEMAPLDESTRGIRLWKSSFVFTTNHSGLQLQGASSIDNNPIAGLRDPQVRHLQIFYTSDLNMRGFTCWEGLPVQRKIWFYSMHILCNEHEINDVLRTLEVPKRLFPNVRIRCLFKWRNTLSVISNIVFWCSSMLLHVSVFISFCFQWKFTSCLEKQWRLTIVGTINNFGQFIGFPVAGYFSDKWVPFI
jgi:hypothetical protein